MTFETALANTLGYEGGYADSPSDTGGATINGISSKWWPDDFAKVKALTDAGLHDQAAAYTRDFYKKNFWNKIGGDDLPPQIQNVAFDTAVNNGVTPAKKMIAQSGDDPNSILDARQKADDQIAQNSPGQAANAPGWHNRIDAQRTNDPDIMPELASHPDPDIMPELAQPASKGVPKDVMLDAMASGIGKTNPVMGAMAHFLLPAIDDPKEALSSAITGAADPAIGVAQDEAHGLSYLTSLGHTHPNIVSDAYGKSARDIDQYVNKRESDYNKERGLAGKTGFDWSRLAGNAASPMNMIGGEITEGLPAAKSFLARIAQGAATGAGYASAMPVQTDQGKDFASAKASQAETGAVGGAGIAGGGSILSSIISPKVAPGAKKLMDEGISLTPGQIKGGNWKAFEDKLTSVPVIGGFIKNAQNQSFEDLNKVAINRALKPIGEELPKGMVGRDAIDYAQSKLGKAYDDLLPELSGNLNASTTNKFGQHLLGEVPPSPFLSKVRQVIDNDYYDMHPDTQEKLYNILKKEIVDRVNEDGSFTGQQAKTVEMRLGEKIRQYGVSQDSDSQMLASALGDVKDIFKDQLSAQNLEAAQKLQKINSGYANFKRVQRAAASTGANNGVFTPAQLQSAVKALDRSKDKGSFAKGQALMQDLSDTAKDILPSKVNDSGTAGRELVAWLLGGGAGAAMGHPYAAAGASGLAGMYTRPGQYAVNKALTARPGFAPGLAQMIEEYTNPASALAKYSALSAAKR